MPLSKIESASLETAIAAVDLAYTGTLTGGTGVVNLGSGQVYKDASGNVGIGTSSPTASSSNKTLTLNSPATFGSLVDFKTSETLNFRIFSGVSNSVLSVKTATPLIFETNDTERARIDSSGNVGIGTSSPTYKLHVSGTGYVSSYLTAGGISADTSSALLFRAGNNSEAARIDISGNLLVGTTTVDARLTVLDANNWVISSKRTGTGGEGHIRFDNANGYCGAITTSGSSTAYNTSSDYRLKEAITPMTGALARNALLNPVFYKWKVDGSEGEGFVAHELQGPFPNAVTGEKDAVDADGKPVYQGIGTGPLDGHFAACINDLQAIIQTLTARITALETA